MEDEIESWQEYRRALRPDDQKAYDTIMNKIKKKVNAAIMK